MNKKKCYYAVDLFMQHIKGRDANISLILQIKSLSVEQIIKFASTLFDIHDCLPDMTKKYPSRLFVWTIGTQISFMYYLVNILAEDEFAIFIASKMDERKTKLILTKRLEVSAILEFVNLLTGTKYKLCKLLLKIY